MDNYEKCLAILTLERMAEELRNRFSCYTCPIQDFCRKNNPILPSKCIDIWKKWLRLPADSLPKTVAAKPVNYGRNKTQIASCDEFICSECDFILEDFVEKVLDEDNGDFDYCQYEIEFCPHCGAEIRRVTDDD